MCNDIKLVKEDRSFSGELSTLFFTTDEDVLHHIFRKEKNIKSNKTKINLIKKELIEKMDKLIIKDKISILRALKWTGAYLYVEDKEFNGKNVIFAFLKRIYCSFELYKEKLSDIDALYSAIKQVRFNKKRLELFEIIMSYILSDFFDEIK